MALSVGIMRFINLLCFVLIIVINALGYFLPLGDSSFEAERTQTPLQPLGPAFAIWALIYLFMFFFIVYQLFPSTYKYRYINVGITPYYWLNTIGNIGWILVRAYVKDPMWPRLVFIYLLLITNFIMYSRVTSIAHSDISNLDGSNDRYFLNLFFGRLWLSFYTAWVLIAALIDSFAVFTDNTIYFYIAAAIALGVIGLFVLIHISLYRDVAFGLTIVWSCLWIALSYVYIGNNDQQLQTAWPEFISAVVVGAVILLASGIIFIVNIFFVLTRSVRHKRKHAEADTVALRV